ncbi:MAG TPA: amino acid adenylation domain-containing protein, partial [Thermoanaerobaculia bacterium]|nr:amino acid adenylation domain-containing protein [Thermoanaerobaculia bacterium]
EDWVLLTSTHHIATDGWSGTIFFEEWIRCYAAILAGEAPRLPELPVQYADFAVWQRRWLEGEVLERELAYWRERLAGAPQALELPLDRPRPAVRSGAGGTLPAVIPAALTAALSELSRREGATLFMTLTSAFQALLGRWAGQDDVLIGTPVAGRNRREIEGLIGFFVNTLVLRAELAGSPPFHELLGRARTTTLDAFAHQALPFERLVEAVAPERDLTRSPLFQVMFAFQNVPQGGTGIPGLKLSPLPVDLEVAKFELMLTLAESAGGLAGTLEYDADLFDRSTAARLLSHLGRFLEAVASDPACRIGEVPLLDPAERHQLLVEWNDSGEDHAGGMCLHELVGAQVERSPDAVAVSFEGEELSYAELERRANRLAWRLRELGVGPEVPVAMCVERSPAMVVGLLAVLKAGGAYVPLDPDYPAERLAYMIEDSGASLLLAQSHLVLRLPAGDTRVLLLDGEEADSAFAPGAPEERPLGGAVPDSLLYIIYTSGSTGRPKGVMVRHRGVVNRLLWAERAYPVTAADRVLQKAPFSFDFSVWECFGPLLAGARLVLARPGGQREGRYLARTVLEQGITLLHFVPAMLQVFLEEEGLESCHSLRFVFSGGDALSSEVRDRFRARLPEGVLLRNQYGPTEISIDMTEWVCDAGDETGEGRRQPPIGRPIGNGEAYVVDAELAPVPVGVAGELLLGGEGVARGYRGRPDLTAERFIPSARHGAAGARLYRTGDRARWRPDGNLEFLGRVDQQVKIRGYRIEPGEIESVLLAHPAVREVAVAVRERGDRHLVACVVPAGEADLAPDELRSFARERLPEYMVPARFLVLEALPLTPSGKVDRRALAALELSAEHQARTLVLPRTPVEETLAAIWKELLGVEEIGVEDSFFDLGGHSLLATRLFSRVQHAFGVDLSLRQIFHAPTIAALAQAVEEQLPPPEPTAVDLDRLLDQLEMLSDEEVAARLAELGGLDGGTPGG